MSEFVQRRERLFDTLKENSCVVVFAGSAKTANADEMLPFKVNSNFFYLTNFCQENSVLMMINGLGENKTYLFIEDYDETKEKWTGKRASIDEAIRISEINSVLPLSNFESMLSLALTNSNNQYGHIKNLYLDLTEEQKIKPNFFMSDFQNYISMEYPHLQIENVFPNIRDLRMIKTKYEVEQIMQAIAATNSGINYILNKMHPGLKEYSLSDEFSYYGNYHEHRELTFDTIVAGGKNAIILHYPQQLENIQENDTVLFDLGFKHNGYCADISRTYPVSGHFTEIQKQIYEAVLNTNKAVIEFIKPGLTLKDLNEFAKECLKKECVERKLIKNSDDITKYYYHNVSHHLGIDCHDISNREKPLENGNVITVEPGLYFKEFFCGVRIEDDVLIEDGRAVVLSNIISKEIKDVERLLTRGK